MKTKITEKELRFVHEYVTNGFRGAPAYRVAFTEEGKEPANGTCSSGAYQLLQKQIIQDAIDAEEGSYKGLAREMVMGRKEVLAKIKDIVWGKRTVVTKDGVAIEIEEDGKTKIAALNTLVKLTGDFSPERKEIDFIQDKKIDTKNMTDQELRDMQNALMSDM